MNARTCLAIVWLATMWGSIGTADEPVVAEKPPAIESGDALPEFVSTDEEGKPWKSAEHVGKNVVVFYFYPGDFTGGCIKQAEAFREGLSKLEEQGVELVGVSGDEATTHKIFKETYGLKHALLADPKGELAQALGIPVSRGEKVRLRGADGKVLLQPMKNAEGVLPNGAQNSLLQRPVTLARWTIVVGPGGDIASVRKNVNPTTDAQEVLELVAMLRK